MCSLEKHLDRFDYFYALKSVQKKTSIFGKNAAKFLWFEKKILVTVLLIAETFFLVRFKALL